MPEGAQMPFESPLRFVAVLSAVGQPRMEEWNGLYAAVKKARDEGLPMHVTVLSGDERGVIDVVDAIQDDELDVLPVPDTAAELTRQLQSLEPHLLHLYCHGAITNGVHLLEIGTIRDFDREDVQTSSVVVRVEELGVAMANAHAWAVVLNTCRGAETGDEALTHAEEIVNSGVPVAVGMRRLVESVDAVTFSTAFYPALFSLIRQAVAMATATGETEHNRVGRHPGSPATDAA